MRPLPCLVSSTIACWLALASPALASVLGVAPSAPPIWHPARELPRDEVFVQRDALEDRLYAQGFRTASEDLELAVLNLCTERPEDRLVALAILGDLARRDPGRLDVQLWTAYAHQHARDAAGAIRSLESAREQHEGVATYHHALGHAHWFDARRHLKRDALDASLRELRRACEIDSTSAMNFASLASVALVADRPEAAVDFVPTIAQGQAVPLAIMLLSAAISSYEPETQERAENLFGQAIAAMPADLAGAFEHGDGRLPGVPAGDVAAAAAYWHSIDADPLRSSNAQRLEFWRRLVQTDVLWGDPTTGTPGWQTETGDAWVRWGRPTVLREFTPDIGPIVSVGKGRGPADANGQGVRNNQRTWVWTWVRGVDAFSLNFVDTSYYRDWRIAPESDKMAYALARDVPISLPIVAKASAFDLAIETALLPTTRERTTVLTSVAVVASDEVADRRVEDLGDVELEWALFDAADRRIDQGSILADPSLDRDALLASVDPERRANGLRPARATRFGLDVPPGTYRLAVEGEDTITGARRWIDRRFVVRGRPADAPIMSALVLGASFGDYRPTDDIPSAFVRYATVVIPAPERVLPRAQDRLYVYFEVYDLGLEPDGRTRFSVSYRVTPVGVADGIPRIDEFTEERTGISPDGAVIKGTALDLQRLEPGAHELVVTVVDLVERVRMERSLEFLIEEPR